GSSVGPPTFDSGIGHLITLDVHIVDVSNFKLAASGWFQPADDFKNGGIVHVQACNRVIGLWNFRLLFDPRYPITIDHRNAEALRVFHFLEVDLRVTAALNELGRGFAHTLLVNVVT